MSKKVVRKPRSIIPTNRTYDLDTVLGRGRLGEGGASDELDQILKDHAHREAQKIKKMEVEKIGLEMQVEMDKMRSQLKPASGSPAITQEEVAFLQGLPEDQRATAIQAMAAFKGSLSGGKDSTGNMAPLLVMSMLQGKPQTSMVELVTALKGLNEIINTGKPAGATTDATLSIARLLLELRDKDHATVTGLYQELLKERNIDPVQYTESIINVAKGMGMAPSTGTNFEATKYAKDIELKIEEMKWDRQMKFEEMKASKDFQTAIIDKLGPAVDHLTQAGASRLSGARPGITSLTCPNCGNTPIFVSPEKPIANCDRCGSPVTTAEFAAKIQEQRAREAVANKPVTAEGVPKGPVPPKSVEYEGGDVTV